MPAGLKTAKQEQQVEAPAAEQAAEAPQTEASVNEAAQKNAE